MTASPTTKSTHRYRGHASEGGERLVTVDGRWPLDPRFDLYHHSPTGFAWGYRGSGPSQLALALLAHHLAAHGVPNPERHALAFRHPFKERVLATFGPDADWQLTSEAIGDTLAVLERDAARS